MKKQMTFERKGDLVVVVRSVGDTVVTWSSWK